MPTDPTPYRFALRVLIGASIVALGLFGVDRVLWSAAESGHRLLRSVPPPFVDPLLRSDDKILYLVDSVGSHVSWRGGDVRRRRIGQLIHAGLGEEVVNASQLGWGAHVIHEAVRFLVSRDIRPRCVVLAVNPASFGQYWAHMPALNMVYQRKLLSTGTHYPVRALQVLRWDFGETTTPQRDEPVLVDQEVVGSMRDVTDPSPPRDADEMETNARLYFLARYGRDVRAAPWWGVTSRTVKLLRDAGIPVVVYVTPVDTEGFRDRVDRRYLEFIESNIARLWNAVEATGAPCIDLSRAVPPSGFDYPAARVNEHLNEHGRAIVADALVRVIRSQLQPR